MRFIAWFVGRPRFRLRDSVGLAFSLAIGGTMLMVREVAVGLSGRSL